VSIRERREKNQSRRLFLKRQRLLAVSIFSQRVGKVPPILMRRTLFKAEPLFTSDGWRSWASKPLRQR